VTVEAWIIGAPTFNEGCARLTAAHGLWDPPNEQRLVRTLHERAEAQLMAENALLLKQQRMCTARDQG